MDTFRIDSLFNFDTATSQLQHVAAGLSGRDNRSAQQERDGKANDYRGEDLSLPSAKQ